MDKFLKDGQHEVFIHNEEINERTKELLNTKINPINIREQFDNIILDIYALGKASPDEIEDALP